MSKEPPKYFELEKENFEKNPVGRNAPAPEKIVDENGRILVGREAEQYAVNATAQVEKNQIGKDLELSRKGSLQNGRQNRGASLSAKIRDTQKEKDKKDKELRSAISEAQKALEASLAELTAELKEIDEGLNAIAKLRALRAIGTFDKDNAEHIVLMQQAGVTSKEMESLNGGVILDEKEKNFHERREDVIKESKVLIQEAEAKGYSSEEITRFKQKLEQADRSVAYDAAVNQESSQELQSAAAQVHTGNHNQQRNSFSSFASGLEDIDGGIESKDGNIDLALTFTNAADLNSSSEASPVSVPLNLRILKV